MSVVPDDTERLVDRQQDRAKLHLVLSGALPGDRTRVLLGGRRLLGRATDCDVQLDLPEVTRHHAEVYRSGTTIVLRDLGSTNGSFVDGQPIQHCPLREGSVVRLGGWLGVVEALREDELELGFGELAPGLFGGSRLRRVVEALNAVARSDLSVALVGATGSGKERLAFALHAKSERRGPFYAVNCAALPLNLAESELFGHARGAFTGAESRTSGHFRAADGGTLLLDELQDLPLPMQAKVLRAIESKQVIPLGETRPLHFDARIVVTAQRPLDDLVAEGKLREDLAMRLNGFELVLPGLRDRRVDVPSLFWQFLRDHSSGRYPAVSSKFYARLCSYAWPGNVRELELLARRMLALHGSSPLIDCDHLPEKFSQLESAEPPPHSNTVFETRDDQDLFRLKEALEDCGSMKGAAERIGISRQRAYRLMSQNRDDAEKACS